ncbi:MAG: hypothetical protein HQ596_05515 [Candidatus Saganbacteria bacterium]|nr:hypothetical protein [Candidatus Saganbacteria bacterium]
MVPPTKAVERVRVEARQDAASRRPKSKAKELPQARRITPPSIPVGAERIGIRVERESAPEFSYVELLYFGSLRERDPLRYPERSHERTFFERLGMKDKRAETYERTLLPELEALKTERPSSLELAVQSPLDRRGLVYDVLLNRASDLAYRMLPKLSDILHDVLSLGNYLSLTLSQLTYRFPQISQRIGMLYQSASHTLGACLIILPEESATTISASFIDNSARDSKMAVTPTTPIVISRLIQIIRSIRNTIENTRKLAELSAAIESGDIESVVSQLTKLILKTGELKLSLEQVEERLGAAGPQAIPILLAAYEEIKSLSESANLIRHTIERIARETSVQQVVAQLTSKLIRKAGGTELPPASLGEALEMQILLGIPSSLSSLLTLCAEREIVLIEGKHTGTLTLSRQELNPQKLSLVENLIILLLSNPTTHTEAIVSDEIQLPQKIATELFRVLSKTRGTAPSAPTIIEATRFASILQTLVDANPLPSTKERAASLDTNTPRESAPKVAQLSPRRQSANQIRPEVSQTIPSVPQESQIGKDPAISPPELTAKNQSAVRKNVVALNLPQPEALEIDSAPKKPAAQNAHAALQAETVAREATLNRQGQVPAKNPAVSAKATSDHQLASLSHEQNLLLIALQLTNMEALLLEGRFDEAETALREAQAIATNANLKLAFSNAILGYFYAGILTDTASPREQQILSEMQADSNNEKSLANLSVVVETSRGETFTDLSRNVSEATLLSIEAEFLLNGVVLRMIEARDDRAAIAAQVITFLQDQGTLNNLLLIISESVNRTQATAEVGQFLSELIRSAKINAGIIPDQSGLVRKAQNPYPYSKQNLAQALREVTIPKALTAIAA